MMDVKHEHIVFPTDHLSQFLLEFEYTQHAIALVSLIHERIIEAILGTVTGIVSRHNDCLLDTLGFGISVNLVNFAAQIFQGLVKAVFGRVNEFDDIVIVKAFESASADYKALDISDSFGNVNIVFELIANGSHIVILVVANCENYQTSGTASFYVKTQLGVRVVSFGLFLSRNSGLFSNDCNFSSRDYLSGDNFTLCLTTSVLC